MKILFDLEEIGLEEMSKLIDALKAYEFEVGEDEKLGLVMMIKKLEKEE